MSPATVPPAHRRLSCRLQGLVRLPSRKPPLTFFLSRFVVPFLCEELQNLKQKKEQTYEQEEELRTTEGGSRLREPCNRHRLPWPRPGGARRPSRPVASNKDLVEAQGFRRMAIPIRNGIALSRGVRSLKRFDPRQWRSRGSSKANSAARNGMTCIGSMPEPPFPRRFASGKSVPSPSGSSSAKRKRPSPPRLPPDGSTATPAPSRESGFFFASRSLSPFPRQPAYSACPRSHGSALRSDERADARP